MKDLLLKRKNTFKTFEINNGFYVYDGNTGMLLKTNQSIYDWFKYSDMFNIENEYDELLLFIENKNPNAYKTINEFSSLYKEKDLIDHNAVHKLYEYNDKIIEEKSYNGSLWLNISHDCNLSCQYCYAKQGSYGGVAEIMDIDTVNLCVNKWFDMIENLNKKKYDVVFFGGEPLVNKKTFLHTINLINTKLKTIDAKARYFLTTNGTIVDEDILKSLNKNNFVFSVSIDGLKEIHDRNRPFHSSIGSYSLIEDNIKKLLSVVPNLSVNMVVVKRDIPYILESVHSLWNLGIKSVNVALSLDPKVRLNNEDMIKYYEQMKHLSNLTYQNIINGKYCVVENFIEVLSDIKNNQIKSNCSLFTNGMFLFDPKGDVYKCHKAVGMENMKIGNISDDNLSIFSHKLIKEEIEKCSDCWAQVLCGDGCPLDNKLYTNNLFKPYSEFCTMTKIILELSIRMYISLFSEYPEELKKYYAWR